MDFGQIKSNDNIVYSWSKGTLFYRIEKNYVNTGECIVVARIPVWRTDAEKLTIHMTKGLEWGRLMQW